MRPLGVIGNLSRDVIAGTRPQIGGGPWHAARALHVLGTEAFVLAKCGREDRHAFQAKLASLGVPVFLAAGQTTTGFSFAYDEHGVRTMSVESIGEPWRYDELPPTLLRRIEWLQVAPLLRGEVDAALLERLGRGRRLLLDAQGLVRARQLGPLVLDADFDPELLRHVTVLKLSVEEAEVVADGHDLESLASLGVPEVVVTFGLEGSLVLADGVATRVPAHPVHRDPTGAGDAFGIAYLAARAAGHAPVSAARRATALVAALLQR